MKRVNGVLALTALLAACGGGGVAGGGAGSRWNVADACKTLDKAAVAKAAGQPVTATENIHDAASAQASGASVSTCTYTLAHGTLAVMTRVSQDALSDAEIDQMSDGGGMLPKGEPIAGFGMKAFWTDKTRQLQVFADRHHYLNIAYAPELTLPGTPPRPGPDPKTLATTLARPLL